MTLRTIGYIIFLGRENELYIHIRSLGCVGYEGFALEGCKLHAINDRFSPRAQRFLIFVIWLRKLTFEEWRKHQLLLLQSSICKFCPSIKSPCQPTHHHTKEKRISTARFHLYFNVGLTLSNKSQPTWHQNDRTYQSTIHCRTLV